MTAFTKPKIFYRGFSTAKFNASGKTLSLTDIELVKEDLLNHIFTAKGERVMQPKYGTRIPDLAFEPLDRDTLAIVEEDIREVIKRDPRVMLISLSVNALPNNNTIIAFVELHYVEFEVTDTLYIDVPLGS